MKKLLLLVLFVCIGSINAQENEDLSKQIRVTFYGDNVDKQTVDYLKNFKYYKNTLGDKYEILKNSKAYISRDKSYNDVDYWNQKILYLDYNDMFTGNISSMTFHDNMAINEIVSEEENYIITSIWSKQGGIRMSRTYVLKNKGKYDNTKQVDYFKTYDNIYPINLAENRRWVNGLNIIKEYNIHSRSGNEMISAEHNYEGGDFKKNGIEKRYSLNSWEFKDTFIPAIEYFYIQGKAILKKEYKEIYTGKYSETEFEILNKDVFGNYFFNEFDIEPMIELFLEDYKGFVEYYDMMEYTWNGKLPETIETTSFKITATFEPLEGNTLAMSYGYNDDSQIIIKIDPEKWTKASSIKRWYILYHELGHDVLNLKHGQGGKMMFNFPLSSEITIENFVEDRNYMFKSLFKNVIEQN